MQDNTRRPGLAIILHDLNVGGAELVMLQIANGFAKKGYEVDLVVARAEGLLLSDVPDGIRVVNLKANNLFRLIINLVRYLRLNRPDALLSPFEVTSLISIFARKISMVSTKIVVRISVNLSQHSRPKIKKILERIMLAKIYPYAASIVAVSYGVAEDFSRYTGIPLQCIKIIYNPIDANLLLRMMNESPVCHPFIDAGTPVVLGIGRFTKQKDFSTLIKGFDIIRKKHPARLIILGDGEERLFLERLIHSLGIQDIVDLPGFELNPFRFMKVASVFVLSSRWEGLPNALIQALFCGCPVISTDCPSGPSEILKMGRYGHLVPVQDPEAIAAAIELVLNGDTRRPPNSWLEQYEVNAILSQYKEILGI